METESFSGPVWDKAVKQIKERAGDKEPTADEKVILEGRAQLSQTGRRDSAEGSYYPKGKGGRSKSLPYQRKSEQAQTRLQPKSRN